jgi:hypothetical protein
MVAGIGSLPWAKCPACTRGAPAYCISSRWCGGGGLCEYLCKVDSFRFKKLALVGSNHDPCSRLYAGAVETLRRGEVDGSKLISHRFLLLQIRGAFAFAAGERAKMVKAMIAQGECHG